MGKVVVVNHVTLDGVMQGPGRPDEDTRDGFEHGGWATQRSDEIMADKVSEWMGGEHAFLFGRRSYEDMLQAWNRMGGPYKDGLNQAQKYVASRSSATTLEWPNSTLLSGDVRAAVAKLTESSDGDLVIMGSGELIGSLMDVGMIDVFVLMIHPLVLGTGRRLFGHANRPAELDLVESIPTTTGVILATYRPGRV
ncbi:MAG TPA: dihydrofolate reductase family protein [Solirubrobacteraceae bacterium]|jgi:dihydrofolate reductase